MGKINENNNRLPKHNLVIDIEDVKNIGIIVMTFITKMKKNAMFIL